MDDEWTKLKAWIAGVMDDAIERIDTATSNRGESVAQGVHDGLKDVLRKMDELRPPPVIRVMHRTQAVGSWWFDQDGSPKAGNGQPLWVGEVVGLGRKGRLFVRWSRLIESTDAEDVEGPRMGEDGLWLYPPGDLVEVKLSGSPLHVTATGNTPSFRE